MEILQGTQTMLNKLIKIANKLDQAGLSKEADRLDQIIDKIAQDLMFEQDQAQFYLDGIRKNLQAQIEDKMLVLDSVLSSAPEGKEQAFLSAHLQANPIVIRYPSK